MENVYDRKLKKFAIKIFTGDSKRLDYLKYYYFIYFRRNAE